MTFYRSISAPDVAVDTKHSLISRLYNASIKAEEYARYDVPRDHVNQYGTIWSSPSRAANTFHFDAVPGQTGPATATLDGKLGRLAAHTVVLRPKYPHIVPSLDNLLPPNKRKVKEVWTAPNGAEAGDEPGTSTTWEKKEATGWADGAYYPPGAIVWYGGRMWTTPEAEGEPGTTGSTWETFTATTWTAESSVALYEIVEYNGAYYRKISTTDDGTAPDVNAAYEVVAPTTWTAGTYYPPGTLVEHNGVLYITPSVTGEPGVPGSTWEPMAEWDADTTYPAGSTVVHGYAPAGGGLGQDPDKFQMGYPEGGDIQPLFYRGVTVNPADGIIWMVDANNSFINAAGPDDSWGVWGIAEEINPNGHPDGLSPVGLSDWGYWMLRDAAWMDGYLWVIRQLDQHILKIEVGGEISPGFFGAFATLVAEIPIDTATPTAVLSDGARFYVQEVGSGTLEILDVNGTFQFAEPAPWGNAGVTGIGYDGGNYWTANPTTYEVQLWNPNTNTVIDSRGWSADEEPPRSVHRFGSWLYVITQTWLYRFPIGAEKGILRWTGTKWVCQPTYRWTGSTWVRTNVWRWENGAWVDAEVPCINPHE